MTIIADATCWAALPNGSDGLHVIDIIVDRPEGGHVASVTGFQAHGEACAATWAHANLIAAAPRRCSAFRCAAAVLAAAGPGRPAGCLVRRGLRRAARVDRGDRRRRRRGHGTAALTIA